MNDLGFMMILIMIAATFGLLGYEFGYDKAFDPKNKLRMDCVAEGGKWYEDKCWKLEK